MSAQPDPHAELGVPPTATAAEVHQALRRRLREHHPDTRPQQDETTDSASDQALQRVLAAYETLRQRVASPAVEAPTEGQPHRPDGDPPLRGTAVQWVHAVEALPSQYPARDRTSQGVPRPDLLIRWLLGN
jgi:hypothetical protein